LFLSSPVGNWFNLYALGYSKRMATPDAAELPISESLLKKSEMRMQGNQA
jgi:hypothetical protein